MALVMAALASLGVASKLGQGLGRINQLELQADNLKKQQDITERLGQVELGIFWRRAETMRGAIPASAAFAGVRVNTGSAFEALVEQARNDATEAMQIDNAYKTQIYGLQQQRQQAKFGRKMAIRQLPFDLVGGGLSGAAAGMQFQGGGATASAGSAPATGGAQ